MELSWPIRPVQLRDKDTLLKSQGICPVYQEKTYNPNMPSPILRGEIRLLTIFIPVLNEEGSLHELFIDLEKLRLKLSEHSTQLEVLIHDNCSTDSSWKLISNWARTRNFVTAKRFNRNIGYQQSLTLSFRYAKGDAIVVYQSDRQDPLDLVLEMHDLWLRGSNCILGIANNRAEGVSEKFGRYFFVFLLKRSSDLKLKNWFTDFYLLDRTLYSQFASLPLANQFIRGRIIEYFQIDHFINYSRLPRLSGKSKFNFSRKYALALDALLLHGTKIIRRLTVTAVGFSITAAFVGVLFSCRFLVTQDLTLFVITFCVSLIIVLISFITGLLGIILEYLIRSHQNLHSYERRENGLELMISECIEKEDL